MIIIMIMFFMGIAVYVALSMNNYYMRADRKRGAKEILEDEKGNPILVKKYPFISTYFEGDELLGECIIWTSVYVCLVLVTNMLVMSCA